MRTLLFFGLTRVLSESCSGTLSYNSEVCSSPNFTPDCTWLSLNSASICNSTFTGDAYVNGDGCYISYDGSNCVYTNGTYDSTNLFCCTPGLSSNTPVTSSTNSAYKSVNVTTTSTPSRTCAYRSYDSTNDFSSIQGQNGWYYGYYNGATFTQFTSYAISNTGSAGSVYSWNYNVASNGLISSSIIMPNGAGSCNTPTYGNIAPVLRWYNPAGSCYQDVTVLLSVTHSSSGGGNNVYLTMNGQNIYTNTAGGAISVNSYFNGYSVNSIELTISPINNACDYGQTNYRVTIMPMGASSTVHATNTRTALSTLSASNSLSKSSTRSVSASRSPVASVSQTSSASSTATTFYTGNWTDLGVFNYASADISNLGSMTISQCQLNCWLNPLCGLIVVTTPCTNIALNSSDVYSTVCGQCWLKLTSGWIVSFDGISRSIMFYDRVYPPTTTSMKSVTTTASPLSTSSAVTYSSWNFCSQSGTTVTLPFLGSSAYLMTNVAGSTYVNNNVCNFYVNGAGNSQMFRLTVNSFATEGCCDFLTVYDSSGTQLLRYSGTLTSGTSFLLSGPTIRILFNTDGSVVSSGVFITVDLVYSSGSPTVSQYIAVPTISSSISSLYSWTSRFSKSSSSSQSISVSSVISQSNSFSMWPSASPYSSQTSRASISISPSPSCSSSVSVSASLSSSSSASYSQSSMPSLSSSISQISSFTSSIGSSSSDSKSVSLTGSPHLTNTNYQTFSFAYTLTTSYTLSASNYNTWSVTQSLSPSIFGTSSPRVSFSNTYSLSPSSSPFPSYTLSPTSSVSNLRPAGPPPALPKNLSTLSMAELGGLFNSMALYPPALVGDNLQKLGLAALANSPSGEFGITTDAFSVKVKALPATLSNASIPLSVGKTDISMPVIRGSSAASAIQWTNNPYNSPTAPDSMVLSLNVLNSLGKAIEVKNSSVPFIISMNLDVLPNDVRFLPLPSYMAICSTGKMYVKKTDGYYDAHDLVNVTGIKTWSVPCLLGDWRNVNCTNSYDIMEYTCPPLIYKPKCQYWDSVTNGWSTDGCIPVFSNASLMVCSCTHLTDFSSRVDAVAQANNEIFANAGNVYSLAGLIQYAQWYGIFGGIGLLAFLLGYLATIIDRRGTQAYVKELLNNKSINPFLQHNADTPIFSYDPSSKYSRVQKINKTQKHKKDETDDNGSKNISLCHRIFLQHSRLQFIFKYDPRLSRVFRLLFLFILQFHSLFITALMYNFTYNGVAMQWYDSIFLSLITTALNIPVVRFVVSNMNRIGLLEFKAQFPLLYEEYQRRLDFEMYALHYIFKKPDEGDGANDNISESGLSNQVDLMDDDDDDIFGIILAYICMRGKKTSKKEELAELSHKDLMKYMVSIVKEPFPYYEQYAVGWQKLPCHTWQGALFIAGCCGWLGWCLNYLLLFASFHDKSVGESILTSYATSELSTIFLIQPMNILATFSIYYLVKRFEKYIPKFIKGFFIVRKSKTIPSVYYFSDPWNKQSKSPFTSEFSYSIFVDCASKASGTNVIAYAPISAVADVIDGSNINRHSEVLLLYKRILRVWDELKTNASSEKVALTIRQSTGSPSA